MSPRINLLPAYQRPDRRVARLGYAAAAAGVLLACAGGVYYGGLVRQQQALQARTRALQQEHEQVRATLKRAQELRAREEKVAKVEADLRHLRGRSWWPVVVELAGLTPQGGVAWEVVGAAEDRIRIQGIARGVPEVGQMVTGLVASPYVAGVDVHYANERAPGRYEFALTVRLRAGDGEGG